MATTPTVSVPDHCRQPASAASWAIDSRRHVSPKDDNHPRAGNTGEHDRNDDQRAYRACLVAEITRR